MIFSICIAGLKFNINCLSKDFFKNFECSYSKTGYNLEVTKDAIEKYEYYQDNISLYENEIYYILSLVAKHCLDYNRMMIHGACIKYQNKGYLFIAPSGTGKTTHIKLWKEYLNDEVSIINGDKPMLEFRDNIIVHSTPWNGKEGYGTIDSCTLNGIVVIKQSKNNAFRKLNTNESLIKIMSECFYSIDKECGPKIVNYISKIVNTIPIYELSCDISKEAFDVCYRGLLKNKED